MEVSRTGSFAFLHRPSCSFILASLPELHRVAQEWHRNLCEEHCFAECLRVLEVRNSGKKIRQNERFEGEGDCRQHGEGEREKERGREKH